MTGILFAHFDCLGLTKYMKAHELLTGSVGAARVGAARSSVIFGSSSSGTTQHHADVLLSLLGATTGRKATSSFAFGSFAFGSCIHQSLSRDVGSRARAVLLKRQEGRDLHV